MIIKKSLAETVAEKIKHQIISGFYQTDDKLPIEPELMKDFGVGRSTVREAVKILDNSGYLRVQQGLGTFVKDINKTENPLDNKFSKANLEDLDEVRKLMEMKIAEKAALNRTEKDINIIRQNLEKRKKFIKEKNLENCIIADIDFHISIAIASKNEILIELYSIASKHLKKWFSHYYSDTSSFEETHELHENLLKAIIAKNPEKAWSIAEAIIKWH
ncbi:FadR/GntR family transcriptional regulator [Pseudopedobacter beijingensis]|uniref:FadR/GntR family transcriptional regulator n=1 Tax=Pseudopedobacter beijingensis TaxID=1207056 RepID=A0ABW4IJC0_9SPHI